MPDLNLIFFQFLPLSQPSTRLLCFCLTRYITEKERSPLVTMTVVGLYEATSCGLGTEYVAGSILPTLLPFLVDRTLDKVSIVQSFVLFLYIATIVAISTAWSVELYRSVY